MRGPRASVRVALPWWHDALAEARSSASLPPLAGLAWLVGRGNPTRAPQQDWREWLLGGADASLADGLRRWPAGPSVAAAAGAGPGTALGWAIAQPVHLAAGMDHVRLAPLAEAAPSAAEAEQLAATLRAHFAGDVFDFVDFVDGAWLVRCVDTLDCETHDPAAAVGRNIHDQLPAGPDGARVRSVMNEIQMLLHQHPVNERRVAARRLPINGLWLWGFGTFDAATEPLDAIADWTVVTDDLWLGAFWRAHGARPLPVDAGLRPGQRLIGMTQPPFPGAGESLAAIDSGLLAPLARAVQTGRLRGLEIHDGSRVHTLDAHARFRLWRRPAVPEAF